MLLLRNRKVFGNDWKISENNHKVYINNKIKIFNENKKRRLTKKKGQVSLGLVIFGVLAILVVIGLVLLFTTTP